MLCISDGKQSITVFKDARMLVTDAVAAAQAFIFGGTPQKTTTYDNDKIDVPARPSVTVVVTKGNVQTALIDSSYYKASDFTGLSKKMRRIGIRS